MQFDPEARIERALFTSISERQLTPCERPSAASPRQRRERTKTQLGITIYAASTRVLPLLLAITLHQAHRHRLWRSQTKRASGT